MSSESYTGLVFFRKAKDIIPHRRNDEFKIILKRIASIEEVLQRLNELIQKAADEMTKKNLSLENQIEILGVYACIDLSSKLPDPQALAIMNEIGYDVDMYERYFQYDDSIVMLYQELDHFLDQLKYIRDDPAHVPYGIVSWNEIWHTCIIIIESAKKWIKADLKNEINKINEIMEKEVLVMN